MQVGMKGGARNCLVVSALLSLFVALPSVETTAAAVPSPNIV
ncbi:MAG TPA: hypothetical protein VN786_12215 [Acidimicrobiales bacterium]|nr:hypothetical protein [Acidimicrobiales bacterium]